MYKCFALLCLLFVAVSGKIVVDIVDDGNKFYVRLINNGMVEIPLAGYRIIAADTTWDSISCELEIGIANYESDYFLKKMGIYSPNIHQVNFIKPNEAILSPDDTLIITYFDSNIESIPEIFSEPYMNALELSSVILRGYSDINHTKLTDYNSSDINPPLVEFYFPVHYNRNAMLYGYANDTSGIRDVDLFNTDEWIPESIEEIYSLTDTEIDFCVQFSQEISWQNPGWVVAYDSCGNGTVIECREDISSIEYITHKENKESVFHGNKIDLFNTRHKGKIDIEMRDLKGRLIYSTNVSSGIKSISLPIDSRCISSGIYFITLKSENIQEAMKVSLDR